MLIHGTAHFVSVGAALRYYREQGYGGGTIEELKVFVGGKLADGEISIGKPTDIPRGARLIRLDGGTRYGIEEGTA